MTSHLEILLLELFVLTVHVVYAFTKLACLWRLSKNMIAIETLIDFVWYGTKGIVMRLFIRSEFVKKIADQGISLQRDINMRVKDIIKSG